MVIFLKQLLGRKDLVEKLRNKTMEDLKLYFLNAFAMIISFTEVDMFLKLLLLVVSIGYTVNKWYNLRKKNDDK